MSKKNRKLGNYQKRIVLNALEHCSLPLFCKLIFAEVSRWRSFSNPSETYLANNVTDCINLLFQKVEEKHGWFLVAHSLAYVTAAKNGITESEIEDLLSLGKVILRRVSVMECLPLYIEMTRCWMISTSTTSPPHVESPRCCGPD